MGKASGQEMMIKIGQLGLGIREFMKDFISRDCEGSAGLRIRIRVCGRSLSHICHFYFPLSDPFTLETRIRCFLNLMQQLWHIPFHSFF